MANAAATTAGPPARGGRIARAHGRAARAWFAPALEALALIGVIVLLWPAFDRIAGFGDGRGARYAQRGVDVNGLPAPLLPAICQAHGALAAPALADAWCAPRWLPWLRGDAPTNAVPPPLQAATQQAQRAFAAPLRDAQQRADALRLQQHEGLGDLRDTADAVNALEADLQPYVARFQIDADAGPRPLRCAWTWLQQRAAAGELNADLLLAYAATLDGRALPAAMAAPGLQAAACDDDGAAALAATAALMADARQSLLRARKNDAMRALQATAGWQWAGAMALAYGFLLWSRRARSALAGVGAALLAWSLAAWAARVPWPLAGPRGFEPARLEAGWFGAPSGVMLVLGGLGLACALMALLRGRPPAAPAPMAPSSRFGMAGLAAATGLGWLVLLDLSAHGHALNRYLALYHQGHLWLGLLLFSLLLFARRPLARGLSRTLAAAGTWRRRLGNRQPPLVGALALLLAAAAALAAFGGLLSNLRQFTSELGRVWLIVGAAWFFLLRAGPLAARLAERPGRRFMDVSIWRYAWPLFFVVGMLVAAMVLTRDMGPLLIAAYGSGAFVGAALAMWWQLRGGGGAAAAVLALAVFIGWIVAVTAALFQAGEVDPVTAARLESLGTPLASANDQLALVSWFQRAAPPQGHGLGAVPWCGHAPVASCSGVPAQIHSDYTFTALVGVFGPTVAWGVTLGTALWLHRLVRRHGRVTRGEPRLVVQADGRLAAESQALISWLVLGWVVLTLGQLAVTVAGNLAVLPLTGVTFPFVSYGMSSLLVNLAFLALAINVELPAAETAHA
ncbi:FtsW/RodA/SpoVE family cell cycle protein [Aquabacterium humicola]|uniref:FtsW/RodA/SpoVE family cell cycle protein n=1 Tax=Aquabacterium humicola TaxID=3237377 RepID=UPI0025435736|nr:FtsW/RodA/SpoVE family cell cycle protein [Rubrivivax pictus]